MQFKQGGTQVDQQAVATLEPDEKRRNQQGSLAGGVEPVEMLFQQIESQNKNTAITVSSLDAFFGKKQVLKNLSISMQENEITALIGPSGCGKTTFLRTLNRMSDMVPSFRRTGTIEVFGQDIGKIRDVEGYRRGVGMLFQRPNPFPMSILDNVTLALKMFGIKKKERMEIAQEKLNEVGLWEDLKDRLDHSPAALSGGQQQRLCLARALAVEPKVLLLDEPASALDPKSTRLLEDLFMRISSRMTLVIVTHNLAQAKRIATRTAFMEAGELVEYGFTDDVFHNPQDSRTQIYVEEQSG